MKPLTKAGNKRAKEALRMAMVLNLKEKILKSDSQSEAKVVSFLTSFWLLVDSSERKLKLKFLSSLL
jgi:hypothetical protein